MTYISSLQDASSCGVLVAKGSYKQIIEIWLPSMATRELQSELHPSTFKHTGQYVTTKFPGCFIIVQGSTGQVCESKNIVAAFQGMHVSPAKHSYAWLPRKCD